MAAKTRRRAFRRVLITGVSGSGGSYLAEHIAAAHPGVELHGLARWRSSGAGNPLPPSLRRHECDLLDFPSVLAALRAARPDAIFHLASHANVRASFVTPVAVVNNNVMGTLNLLEAVRAAGLDPVVQLCSTSEVYGQVDPKDVPIRESAPLRPVSPYAVSKTAQDLLAFAYFKSWGLRVVRTRMFTYLNPRRADLFATSFARQIALIERGRRKTLLHGNLDSVRTFIDVRDAMAAYWLACERGEPGEVYNIGGETTMTVGRCLDLLKSLSRVRVPCRTDPALLRPADVTLQIPCVEKFRAATGWAPRCTFKDSLRSLLEHWRKEAAKPDA